MSSTDRVFVLIEDNPFCKNHETQPAKDADHEEHLRNELTNDIYILLEVTGTKNLIFKTKRCFYRLAYIFMKMHIFLKDEKH